MFVIRQAGNDDHAMLMKLSRGLSGADRPSDPDEIARRIGASRDTFAGRVNDDERRQLIFVLEDTDTGDVMGMSCLRARASRADRPLAFLQVRKREHYSEDLQTGHVHLTVQLVTDETPTSEVAGLVVAPPYRRHRERLGSLLSLVRFHFLGLQREWFTDTVMARLTPPRPASRADALWERLGRRFINLRHDEAEQFRGRSCEFITALFPAGEIYVSMLPPEARQLIGHVDPQAEPARAMLEGLGFASRGRVDPFDGGPILEADTNAIGLVTAARVATLGDPAAEHPRLGFVSRGGGAPFRAVRCRYAEAGETISIPGETAGLLRAQMGDTVGVTPLGEVT